MNNKKSLQKILMSVFALGSFFATIPDSYALCPGVQLSLYGGGMNASIKKTDLVISPLETDTITDGGHSTLSFTPGAGIAYNFVIAPGTLTLLDSVSLGLTYYYFKTTHEGDVYLFENPLFDDFEYNMTFKSSRLMVDTEWNFQNIWANSVIFAEAGAGFARTNFEYNDEPKPGLLGGGINLPGHTENNFAWQLGGGFKVPVPRHPNFLLSLRYLYANLGTVSSSTHGNIDIQESIKVKLRTQSVLLGVTYAWNS